MQEIAITNAMVAFLVAVAQNVLPNATADVAIPNDFVVLLPFTAWKALTGQPLFLGCPGYLWTLPAIISASTKCNLQVCLVTLVSMSKCIS